MKDEDFNERRKKYTPYIKSKHIKVLRNLEDITKALWTGEKLISYYTEHGVEHSYRIIERILMLTTNSDTKLDSDDYFILFASAFLHDIGMQCDLSQNTNIYNKLKEENLIEIPFEKKAAEYTNDQKEKLRDKHNEITRYWMLLAFQKKLINTTINEDLTSAMHAIMDLKNGLIEDIAEVCVYHTKRDIKNIGDELESSEKNNKKLLANIFRLSDELDFDSNRVRDYNAIQSFNMHEYSNFIYWYHKQISIDMDLNDNIVVSGYIQKEDADIFRKRLDKDIIQKNKHIIDYLNYEKMRINIQIKIKSPYTTTLIPPEYKIYFENKIEKSLVKKTSFTQIYLDKKNLIQDKADDFFNAMPPTIENIHFSYDVLRTEYIRPEGIKDVIEKHIASNKVKLLAIKGRSGSGKSTLIKRIMYDFYEKYDIYEFTPHNLTLDVLEEVKEYIVTSDKNNIFIFDDASILKNYNIKPSDFLNININNKSVLFIFSEQANQWNYLEKINELRRATGDDLKEFTLTELDNDELEKLVDRIIELEDQNLFKRIKSNLSREKRLALCKNDNIIVVLLLILRYGQNISSIIEEEYNTIPSDSGKNIYASICLLSELNINFSTTSIRKSFGITKAADIARLRNAIDGLVKEKSERYAPRHRELGKLLFRYIYQDTAQIKEDMLLLFQNIDSKKSLDVEIFKQFLLKNDYKLIAKLLKTEYAIKDFLNLLIDISQDFDNGIKKRIYLLHSYIYRHIFKDKNSALTYLDESINIDNGFALAIKEKAWIYFSQGDEENWTKEAKNASKKSDDTNILLQCAYLLSLGNMKSFYEAGILYNKALKINKQKVENYNDYKNYIDAKKVLEYIEIDDDEIPKSILEELRPKAIFWKIKKGMNPQYERAFQGELSYALQNDKELELELDDEIKGGKLLKALYKGYHARNLYLRWYREYTDEINEIEIEIEKLFTDALQLYPSEIIIRSHYSTFIKEVKGKYPKAMQEINKALEYSEKSKYDKFKNHPLLYNNKALLYIDGFLKKEYSIQVLEEAEKLLKYAIKRVEELESNFYWPYENMEYLKRVKRNNSNQ